MAQRQAVSYEPEWFAENLRHLMRISGFRKTNVAHYAGVTAQAVAKWLAGSLPGTRCIVQVANAFGLSMDEILGPPEELKARYDKWEDLGLPDERRPFLARSATGASRRRSPRTG